MMFRGSSLFPTFSSLSEAFETLGGEWNAATGLEYTSYFYSGVVGKEQTAFKIMSDIILRPTFNDLETEKRIVLRELEGELNENQVNTDVDLHVLKRIWPNTSLSQPIIGSESSIKSIQVDDLREWHQRFYTSKNMILTVVGGSLSSAKNLAASYFADTPKTKPTLKNEKNSILPKFTGPTCEIIENADNEYDVQISFLCEGTNSPLTYTYDLIARILGDGFSSRLVKRIREELGLVYDISASFQQYDGGGTFNINSSITEENAEVFFKELFEVLNGLSTTGPTKDELQRHHNRALTDYTLIPSDPPQISFRIGWALLSGGNPHLNHWRTKFEKISISDIKKSSATLFDRKKMAIVALGPKSPEIEKKFLKATNSSVL
jgi:predicted Zn-dependent peptidase